MFTEGIIHIYLHFSVFKINHASEIVDVGVGSDISTGCCTDVFFDFVTGVYYSMFDVGGNREILWLSLL